MGQVKGDHVSVDGSENGCATSASLFSVLLVNEISLAKVFSSYQELSTQKFYFNAVKQTDVEEPDLIATES